MLFRSCRFYNPDDHTGDELMGSLFCWRGVREPDFEYAWDGDDEPDDEKPERLHGTAREVLDAAQAEELWDDLVAELGHEVFLTE